MDENLNATMQASSRIVEWLTGSTQRTAITWPRHGFIETLLEIPFILPARMIAGADQAIATRALALHAPIFSALLVTLIFIWTHAITRSFAWSFPCALGAGFATMIWPYAYIGLETSQSLFLTLAGFLAFRENVANRRLGALSLTLVCAIAVSAKSNGLFLWPAVIYAIACYFLNPQKSWRDFRLTHLYKTILAAAVALLVYLANNHVKQRYWGGAGATTFVTSEMLVKDVTSYLLNAWSLFFSPNKSFFMFAPITILAVAGIARAYRVNPRIVIFTLLVVAGNVGALSMLVPWADEVWGPRYLHVCVAPMVVCFALSRKETGFEFRKELFLAASLVLGFLITFPGCLFSYTRLPQAAVACSHSSVDAYLYDINYNHLKFNIKLTEILVRQKFQLHQGAQNWPPEPRWWYAAPEHKGWKQVNLVDYASPQPVIISLLSPAAIAG
ncbi:MAG: hypothetical protein ACREAB_08685, partial [Blastocatellia bacterium]